jgi:hypothetical protein
MNRSEKKRQKKRKNTKVDYQCVQTCLNANFHTTLSTRRTLGQRRQQISDVVPRMAVQTRPQSLLVEVVSNQTDAAAQHEQTIQHAHAEIVLGLLGTEGTAVAEQVDEADGHGAIDVEDEVVFLGGGDGLDRDGVVE